MSTSRRPVIIWLYVVAAMVLGMVLIGGLTRLTHSGLSMVQWRPVTGWLPPLNETEWAAIFDAYRETPEFNKINHDMTMDGFQSIFWFEYLHRLLGRIVGLVFFIPMLYFIRFRLIKRAEISRFVMLLSLGGLQGFVGWWMVQSGLIDRPDVSHYRLATHLGLASILFAALIWSAFGLSNASPFRPTPFSRLPLIATFLTATTLIVGALVAGLNAGLVFNTFPLMDGQVVPSRLFQIPITNWLDNPMAVQFTHRLFAFSTLATLYYMGWRSRAESLSVRGRRLLIAALGVGTLQVTLGVVTLLTRVQMHVAVTHQFIAFILLAILVGLSHESTHGNESAP